jgi:hypothetical protein
MFFEFMESQNPDGSIGVIGGMLLKENMELNSSYQRFPEAFEVICSLVSHHLKKIFKISPKQVLRVNYSRLTGSCLEVDFIVGADLFMPRVIFEEMNGFDENFFLFFEETDLQKRMQEKGLKRIIINGPGIIHPEGSSAIGPMANVNMQIVFNDSMFKYFRKHNSGLHYFMFYVLITPLIVFPLIFLNAAFADKKRYLKMLIHNMF